MSQPSERIGETVDSEFARRYEYWQRLLDTDGPEVLQEHGAELVAELDSLNPDVGEECDFSGYGRSPVFGESNNVTDEVVDGEISNGTGIHNGVEIVYDEDGHPHIWFEMILHSERRRISECWGQSNLICSYLDPRRSSVVGRNSFDAQFTDSQVGSSDQPPEIELLSVASDTFALTVLGKKFRRQNHQAQRVFVDEYINRIQQESGVTGLEIGVQGTYFYPRRDNAQLGNKITPFNGNYMYGRCIAIDFLGRAALDAAPIRRKSDILDPSAGLCIVSEALQHIPALELVRGDIVHIPISSQPLEIHGATPVFDQENE